jgi:hypothetical protein
MLAGPKDVGVVSARCSAEYALPPVPRYLTAAAIVGALCVASLSGEWLSGILPAAVVVALAAVDYVLWERRGRPWHDWTVILLLLPAIFAAVWITVGGLVTGVERADGERLAFEVGPGVALVGLLCTLISYHGRHHPDEEPTGRSRTQRPDAAEGRSRDRS